MSQETGARNRAGYAKRVLRPLNRRQGLQPITLQRSIFQAQEAGHAIKARIDNIQAGRTSEPTTESLTRL